jgi:hypothetical protein
MSKFIWNQWKSSKQYAHSSHRNDDHHSCGYCEHTILMISIMPVATVSILFWWFSLISDEFWHETSCIWKVISLPFYVYVERKKWSMDVISVFILVWMWMCHSSHGYDDVIMSKATVSILFWWFHWFRMNFDMRPIAFERLSLYLSMYM